MLIETFARVLDMIPFDVASIIVDEIGVRALQMLRQICVSLQKDRRNGGRVIPSAIPYFCCRWVGASEKLLDLISNGWIDVNGLFGRRSKTIEVFIENVAQDLDEEETGLC